MTKSLMQQFVDNGFSPIEIDGEVIRPYFEARIDLGDRVMVEWIRSNSPLVQGLALRLRVPDKRGPAGEGGLLSVDEVVAPSILLWMDTAPRVVETTCVEVSEGAVLRVSNRWRMPNGREDEWLNNFGIKVIGAEPNKVTLHCSDGFGDSPTFDDLVVSLWINRSTTDVGEARGPS